MLGLDKGYEASTSRHPQPAPYPSCGVSRRVPLCPVCAPVPNRQHCEEGMAGRQREMGQ